MKSGSREVLSMKALLFLLRKINLTTWNLIKRIHNMLSLQKKIIYGDDANGIVQYCFRNSQGSW